MIFSTFFFDFPTLISTIHSSKIVFFYFFLHFSHFSLQNFDRIFSNSTLPIVTSKSSNIMSTNSQELIPDLQRITLVRFLWFLSSTLAMTICISFDIIFSGTWKTYNQQGVFFFIWWNSSRDIEYLAEHQFLAIWNSSRVAQIGKKM